MERNLVDVVDELIALYGPVLVRLLEENPEAHGVRTFIGRQNPSALLMDEDMRGYRLEEDEEFAVDDLLPFVDATDELQASCEAISDLCEPLSVDIRRTEDGLGLITAAVHDGLGSVGIQRQADAYELGGGIGFFCRPATFVVTALSDQAERLQSLRSRAVAGIHEVVEAMLEGDLVLNRKGGDASIVSRFLDEFPASSDEPGEVGTIGQRALVFRARSTQDPVKILASAESADFLGDSFGEVPVVRIPAPSEQYAPDL